MYKYLVYFEVWYVFAPNCVSCPLTDQNQARVLYAQPLGRHSSLSESISSNAFELAWKKRKLARCVCLKGTPARATPLPKSFFLSPRYSTGILQVYIIHKKTTPQLSQKNK